MSSVKLRDELTLLIASMTWPNEASELPRARHVYVLPLSAAVLVQDVPQLEVVRSPWKAVLKNFTPPLRADNSDQGLHLSAMTSNATCDHKDCQRHH